MSTIDKIIRNLPAITISLYSIYVIFYILKYGKLFEFWEIFTAIVVFTPYIIRRFYLEGYKTISKEELKNYPNYVKNHTKEYFDGIKIKRKYLEPIKEKEEKIKLNKELENIELRENDLKQENHNIIHDQNILYREIKKRI